MSSSPIEKPLLSPLSLPVDRESSKKKDVKGRVFKYLKNTLSPCARVFKVIYEDMKRIPRSEPGVKYRGIKIFSRILSPVKWTFLLGLAAVHMVTHLTGIAQLALKISRFALKKNLGIKILFSPIIFIAAISNLQDVVKQVAFPSGSKTFSCLNPQSKQKAVDYFNRWLEEHNWAYDTEKSKPFTLKVSTDGGADLEGHYFQPKTPNVKSTVIFQHGNIGCYQDDDEQIKNYLSRGYAVLVYNRRGCINSTGSPS